MKNFGKTTDIKDVITVGYEADNAVLYSTSQSLTNNQKAQARTNIGAGTSNFDGNYSSLSNKPTIPTKTSQLNNDSNFATTSQVEAKYTKPAGGIPKTDLATAVQNSLTAADNAVKYTSQSLTDAQKVQARTNIGAGTSNFSGSYNDLTNRPTIPAAVSIVQSTGTSTSSVMSQKATTDAVNGKLSKTDNTNIEVLGTKKATTTLGGNQLYAPNGVIFGGSAAAAGLVTRGICGVSTPSVGGACTKENLYINYDGNNDFNAGRQIVLNAGTTGNHLGSNMYQYTVPRGDIVKNWVEAKGYATSVKVNGNTIASSGGVVDIGNVIKSHQSIKSINTNNTAAQATNASEAIAGSGTINLHKVAKTGNYNDLLNKPTIPSVSGKLNKTTYEYNEELALGSNGKVLIGVFPMYDTNLTVHISSTTSTTYSGTLVIATQNFGGSNRTIRCNLYGDAAGTLHSRLVIQQSSDATDPRIFIYGNFDGYSKNLVHIQAVGLAGPPEELVTSADNIPTTDLVTIHNVLDENFAKLTGNNKFTGEMIGIGYPYRVLQNEDAYASYLSDPTNAAYTSQTNAAFIINTNSKNRLLISNGLIRYKKESTQYYDLALPAKTGTLATTSDIPIKSASLSGTTLTITL